jgi:hypothetical protein
MRTILFLPGLILALITWILPLAIRLLPGRILSPVLLRAPWLPSLAPWIQSIALPYLGLLLGWISSRDFGLGGHTLAEWLIGAAAAVVLGAVLGRLSIHFSSGRGWGDVRDEARWTLFRAAAWPWVGHLSIAVAAGMLASLAEYAWERRSDGKGFFHANGIIYLIRMAGSAILFLLVHNFFLAMVFYLTAWVASRPELEGQIENARVWIAKIITKK